MSQINYLNLSIIYADYVTSSNYLIISQFFSYQNMLKSKLNAFESSPKQYLYLHKCFIFRRPIMKQECVLVILYFSAILCENYLLWVASTQFMYKLSKTYTSFILQHVSAL
jgi:hypothetical protein